MSTTSYTVSANDWADAGHQGCVYPRPAHAIHVAIKWPFDPP